ncbi:AAA family ATPase [Cellulomonas endophytica]|uniref:AAA family ATPase n=1 Tax=Cellulomonas endophytica TaxID=2494735 RepID=UPI0013E999BE|nr:ATP-binding protein [Cellulomonas endophytica]
MKITSLKITNFKAIRHFEISDLGPMVVIAGPNGSGKSCILDAIRLLKVRVGSSTAQDLQLWLGELQIAPDSRHGDRSLYRDPTEPFTIEAVLEVEDTEVEYLRQNAKDLLAARVWQEVFTNPEYYGQPPQALAIQFPQFVPIVEARVAEHLGTLAFEGTDTRQYATGLSQRIGEPPSIVSDPIIQLLFRTYRPEHVGTIEYFGATRAYARETLSGVHVGEPARQDPRAGQGVVNWQAKLGNVKSELANSYVRALIRGQAVGESAASPLDATMKDLFSTFFPDKTYLGVVATPDGFLEYPVRLRSGEIHDINELSAGEKEIVYGYLRLRSAALARSIILMDEPELHLNPALLYGLAEFYHRNLVQPGNNQMWLVTHSDAILRRVALEPAYSVIHLQPATLQEVPENQAQPVNSSDAIERVLLDLIGDLAYYRPRGKVVLFEGGGDTDFDVEMTRRLFPSVAKMANFVSGGGKRRVSDLYEVLDKAAQAGALDTSFFAVTDRDSGARATEQQRAVTRLRTWDRYHIENYLLEPLFIAAEVRATQLKSTMTPEEAESVLKDCARELITELVSARLIAAIDSELRGCVTIGAEKRGANSVDRLRPSVTATLERLDAASKRIGDTAYLQQIADAEREKLQSAVDEDRWNAEFPGRRIIKLFVSRTLGGKADYEGFRNRVIARMADAAYQPTGMRSVLVDDFGLTDETVQAAGPATVSTGGEPVEIHPEA